MRKKLRQRRGETLVEALAAVLIVTLATLLLCAAAVSAGRIHALSRQHDGSFRRAESPSGTVEVRVTDGSGQELLRTREKLYLSGSGREEYRYYRPGGEGTGEG